MVSADKRWFPMFAAMRADNTRLRRQDKKCGAFINPRGAVARGPGDTATVDAERGVGETCVVCGRAMASERAFGRIYEGGERRTLCSVRCTEKYLRGPDGGSNRNGSGGFLEEFVAAWRWRELGR